MADEIPTTSDPDWPPVCPGCGERHLRDRDIEEILSGRRKATGLPPTSHMEVGVIDLYALLMAVRKQMEESVENENYELANGWKKLGDHIVSTAEFIEAQQKGGVMEPQGNGHGDVG